MVITQILRTDNTRANSLAQLRSRADGDIEASKQKVRVLTPTIVVPKPVMQIDDIYDRLD
jgi:hypothetical protein